MSTVFLGLNHQYGDGPPLIFESMSFDDSDTDDEDQRQDRYATEAQALTGHRRMVAEIAAAMPDARVEDIDDERQSAQPEEEPPTINGQRTSWAVDEYTFDLDATSSGGTWVGDVVPRSAAVTGLFLPPRPSAQKPASDILERIDAATGCQQCEGPSHAGDFCTPECLQAWNARHAVPLPRAEDAALVYPGYDFAHWSPDRA